MRNCGDIVTIMEESYNQYKADLRVKKQNTESFKDKRKKAVKTALNVSESQIYLLAKLIYCEVGAVKDDKCLYLCGSVVLNRIKDKRYPDTMEGVIFQKGQYEVTWNGAWDIKTPDKRCLRIARDLITHGSVDNSVLGMSEKTRGKCVYRFDNVIFSAF